MDNSGNDDERLLERIRKLLNLAEGTRHEDEAQSAMLKAQLLLANNGWDIDDVPGFQDAKKVLNECVDTDGKTPQNWQWMIITTISKNFRLTPYFATTSFSSNGRRIQSCHLVGLKHDVQIGKEVISFAFSWFEKNFKLYLTEWKRENKKIWLYSTGGENTSRTRRMKNDYMMGFVKGLDEKFRKQVEEKALVLIQHALVKEEVDNLNLIRGNAVTITRGYDANAYNRGKYDGNRMRVGGEGGMLT